MQQKTALQAARDGSDLLGKQRRALLNNQDLFYSSNHNLEKANLSHQALSGATEQRAGQLTKSIVFALFLEASSHHVSHQSHS